MMRARAGREAIYSRDLGINLGSGSEAEIFKWFLACLLFGKPIQQEVARRTFVEFVKAGLVTPDAILRAGWDRLVEVLDRGHYVRFDFSTATKLLEVCRALRAEYGTVSELLRQSESRADLARRLQAFKGVGPTTMRIFFRDVAAVWRMARRAPSHGRPAAAHRSRSVREARSGGRPRHSRRVRRQAPRVGRP